MNKYLAHWTCPYCKAPHKTEVDGGDFPNLVMCDMESGGCGQYAVVQVSVQVTIRVRRIEGYDDVQQDGEPDKDAGPPQAPDYRTPAEYYADLAHDRKSNPTDADLAAADFAYDAAREARIFGRGR